MIFTTVADFDHALAPLPAANAVAMAEAEARQAQLTKPVGSLGRLETLAVFMAGWQGTDRPQLNCGKTLIFAGNHGFTVHGVSAFPPSVTAQMVTNFAAGGAAINSLSRAANLDFAVIALELDKPTTDFTTAPAMREDECLAALNAGAAAVPEDAQLLVLGEMGIGNSTAAAALAAQSFGGQIAQWVGPGTGVDDEGMARKTRVITQALALHGSADTPFEILRRLGGREIAAIAGAVLRARQLSIPVMLDGFICCSALAPLKRAQPAVADHCIAGHCSAEPGHSILLEALELTPLLRLDMRLGEGSGAAVAVQILHSALTAHNGMATFAEAGIPVG